MKNVLIIGTTGVLGRELVPRLKAKGYYVRGLVRPESKEKLQAAYAAGLPEFEVAYGNIMDPPSLQAAMQGIDVVISCVSAGQDRTAESRGKAEHYGQMNAIEAAKRAGVKQFIFTSTLFPKNSLGYSFVWAKLMTEEKLRESGLTYTIFRPCGFFYELYYRGEPFVQATNAFPILGDGKTTTQMLAEQDVAKMYVAAIGNLECMNRTLEIGGGRVMTFDELIEEWSRVRLKYEGKPVIPFHIPVTPLRIFAEAVKPFWEQAWGIVHLLDFSYDNMECDMTEPKRILGIDRLMTLKEYITEAYEKKYASRRLSATAAPTPSHN
ncbi:MAG: SDR family oxidoreductase [Chloroherpetonaceae bacterium]|nr:SDR family oxidoreductase [Chloroherpetonaceae bacterium]